MPTIFDKTRLATPEFARYIYKGKGGTRDMNLSGYRHAIKDVIVGTEVRDVKFASYAYEKSSVLDETKKTQVVNLWVSVVVAVKTKDGEVYEACGDANLAELNEKHTENNLVRIAESRARKRAFAQALGISPEDFLPLGKKSRMEDTDTPMADLDADDDDKEKGSHPEVAAEPRKKICLDDLT
jgi:hypothetical protein